MNTKITKEEPHKITKFRNCLRGRVPMIRTYAPLPDRTEQLMAEIVDGGLCVHEELGSGFFERIYRNAVALELKSRGIPFEVEQPFVVEYRGEPVGAQRIDLVVGDAVIVEIKEV